MSAAVVQIQEVSKTQSGSFKAKINGVWHICNRKITAAPPVGAVEVEVGNWHTNDGKDIPTIERWRETKQADASQAAPLPAPKNYMDEASLRYISNVVGSAITAGTLKEPGQILSWYLGAKNSLEGKGTSVPFDDTIGNKDW